MGDPARHPGLPRDRGALPEGPLLGGRVPGGDRDRQSPREARLPDAGGGDPRVPADDPRAAAAAEGDQAASLRHRVRRPPADAPGHEEPLAGRLPGERLQPRVLRPRPGDLRDGQALAERQAAQRPRRGRRGPLQDDPDDQDHGAALELPVAHRREGDPPRPLQADQGRVLHRGHPPDGGVPRQPLRDRGGPRVREGAGSGSAGRRDARRCRWPRARTGRTTASSPA